MDLGSSVLNLNEEYSVCIFPFPKQSGVRVRILLGAQFPLVMEVTHLQNYPMLEIAVLVIKYFHGTPILLLSHIISL